MGVRPLALFKGDVNSRLPQRQKRRFEPTLVNHADNVSELTMGEAKERKIRAAGMPEDATLEDAKTILFSVRHASANLSDSVIDPDRVTEKTPQAEPESSVHFQVVDTFMSVRRLSPRRSAGLELVSIAGACRAIL
jgi:hypothetical protein